MSAIRWVLIEPHDTLFFRDGKPFNQDDEGAAHAASLFPPSPRAIAQMLRAALAAGQGWADGDWSTRTDRDFKGELGNGPDGLGKLTFAPPRLVLVEATARAAGRTVLYPAPLGLVARLDTQDNITEVRRLVPGRQHCCDLRNARLPAVADDRDEGGWKSLDGWYVSQDGLQAFLRGESVACSAFKELGALALTEPRVGIARDTKTRITRTDIGALFTAVHRRLDGTKSRLAICAGFHGTPWKLSTYRPFGGEHRFAWLQEAEDARDLEPPALQRPAALNGVVRYVVVTTTPMLPKAPDWRGPGSKPDPDLPGTIVSACIGKPVMLGGWSSTTGFGPQALRPHIPPGSVWFMEAKEQEFAGAEPPSAIGENTAFGFGGCVYGGWEEREGAQQ